MSAFNYGCSNCRHLVWLGAAAQDNGGVNIITYCSMALLLPLLLSFLQACEVLESAKGYYSVAALSKAASAMANTAALKSGFVPGVLLPARNRHGNAMRLGLLVLGGSNPYRQLAAPRDKACLAARQRAGLEDLKTLVSARRCI